MKISGLQQSEVESVANIHIQELTGFQSILGLPFLRWYYRTSLELPHLFTFIAKDDTKPVGIVTCCENPKSLWLKLFLLDPFGCIHVIIPAVLRKPHTLGRLFSMLSYPGFSKGKPELLTLAVDEAHQRLGIGRKLVTEGAKEFKKRGIRTFIISTYARLPANGFYKKIGCRLIETFTFMGEKMNYYEYSK